TCLPVSQFLFSLSLFFRQWLERCDGQLQLVRIVSVWIFGFGCRFGFVLLLGAGPLGCGLFYFFRRSDFCCAFRFARFAFFLLRVVFLFRRVARGDFCFCFLSVAAWRERRLLFFFGGAFDLSDQ